MPFNPAALNSKAREKYIHIGRGYGSDEVHSTGRATLRALDQHGAALSGDGFVPEDRTKLEEVLALQQDADKGREARRVGKKSTNKRLGAASKVGKKARRRAHALALVAEAVLDEVGTPEADEASRAIATARTHTITSGASSEELVRQLDTLAEALQQPVVAEVLATRGGPDTVKSLQDAANELRAASGVHDGKPGTPSETEALDLLDGVIITLCRAARRAARSYSTRTGNEAVAKAFDFSGPNSEARDEPSTPANP